MKERAQHDKHLTPDDSKVIRWFRCSDTRAIRSVAKYPALAHWLRLVDPVLLEDAFFDEGSRFLVLTTSSRKLYESCRSRAATLRRLEIGLAIGLFRDKTRVAYFVGDGESFIDWREGSGERKVERGRQAFPGQKQRKNKRTMPECRSILLSVAPHLPWNVRQDVDRGWVRLLELNGCFVRLGCMYTDVQYRVETSLKEIELAFEKRFGHQFNIKIERLKYRSRPAK